MKEKPILFCSNMIRAILEGRKTQTRRIVKPQLDCDMFLAWQEGVVKCPFAVARLWVRETWRVGAWDIHNQRIAVDYNADNSCRREWLEVTEEELFLRLWEQSLEDSKNAGIELDEDHGYKWEHGESPCRWRPSIFMPRWASRINLTVKNIRVERLQDITETDAKAEGVQGMTPILDYTYLWESINGKGSWEKNPWVWVVEFEKESK